MNDESRVEQLLRNALGEDIYNVTPQSRVEELLQQLNELIESAGVGTAISIVDNRMVIRSGGIDPSGDETSDIVGTGTVGHMVLKG